MKKILMFTVVMLAMITLSACEDAVINDWDDIVDRGYVIVGLDDTFAPMGFRDESGELVGFDVDLARLVFAELDIEVRFQPIDWNAKELELNAGTIDMIWNGLTITDARKEEILFSDPYLSNSQIVLTTIDQTMDTIASLSGLKVGVQISSASEDAVKANAIVDDLDELVQFDTFSQAVLDLKNATIDAVVVDQIYGRYLMSQELNTYRVMTENFGDEFYGIGFRLESITIRDIVNQTLFDLIDNGDTDSISIEWFAENILLNQ